MKLRKTGWVVWDKQAQKFKETNGMLVYSQKGIAWLAAQKLRKNSPYKLIKIKLSK